jgi:DNA-binding response OmpR family regulator
MSGNAAARETARRLQAVAYLVKPFELDELLGVVRRLTAETTTRDITAGYAAPRPDSSKPQ